MIHGFSARMLERYLEATNAAMDRAHEAHTKNPLEDMSFEGQMRPPRLSPRINERHPFQADRALGGRYTVGVGNSTNIVVKEDVYRDVLKILNTVDEQVGEELYKTSLAIKELCANFYIVPDTTPNVVRISEQVENSLGKFRSLTEDVSIQVRKFVNEIRDIDQAEDGFNFVLSEQSAYDVTNRVSSSIKRQIENMERTSEEFKDRAEWLRNQALQAEMGIHNAEMRICEFTNQIQERRSSQTGSTSFRS